MPRSHPYQPLLLRILHNFHGLCALGAVVTGFWTYDIYDGRFGRLSLPHFPDMGGIHGTFGLWTFLALPALLIYAIHRGHKRLIQSDFMRQLNHFPKPLAWYGLHRLVNTFMLLAGTFAVLSGRMMKEEWLPKGEFHHLWYKIHLFSWATMVIAIGLHLLMAAKVGGSPLLLSIFNRMVRPQDFPTQWFAQVRNWLWSRSQNPPRISSGLQVFEILLLGMIGAGWILPLLGR